MLYGENALLNNRNCCVSAIRHILIVMYPDKDKFSVRLSFVLAVLVFVVTGIDAVCGFGLRFWASQNTANHSKAIYGIVLSCVSEQLSLFY